ncbi:histidine kinase dimerization/phospho-acceptor domain-containing protein, partial [Pseudomonas aeruginosa]|uniref:histidine kinase dimerization/phospho-acceptor domain-containing protein n=1 Tax=Pseudomonas aeruginosa TaxID=287 RepID=UPI00349E6927
GYTQLNRFSEDIAHEFRTPLNNLIGQTEIALTVSFRFKVATTASQANSFY